MPGADEVLVAARSALLDALMALGDHAEEVTLIGAQAIYLHTGAADVALAETTKDSDLVFDPRDLVDGPLLEEAMTAAGFRQSLESPQPGAWLSPAGIPVDLMVPEGVGSRMAGRAETFVGDADTVARSVSILALDLAALLENS